jgi:predicted Zn-dependent protease with MMP-like domain
MFRVDDHEFAKLIEEGIARLPESERERLDNVAFVAEDEPSPAQRQALELRNDQSLFGQYEGVPLSARNGGMVLMPDKITVFKLPLEHASDSFDELRDHVGRTVWHEVAHYYGLGHEQIAELEAREHGRARVAEAEQPAYNP